MKFKENVIKPGMVIHCPKEEDARVLLEYLESLGYVWCNGANICAAYSRWHEHCDRTGYQILGDRKGKITNGDVDSYLCKITEFSDLIEPDGESESANFIKSGEIIAKGISKAIKDAENSTGGEKSTDTSTGMTNQRAIEILADKIRCNEPECGENCVECSGVTQEEENKAFWVAIAALIEKESQKDSEKVDKLIDEYEQTKKADNFHDDTSVLITVEQEYYLSDSDTELIGGERSLNSGKAEGENIWLLDKYMYSDRMARYRNMICRGYSMETVPDAEPDEMTAKEVLEWLEQYGGTQVAEKVFGFDSDGYVVDTGNVLDLYSPQEILDKITAYEAAKKEKPVEVEWINLCRIIQTKDNGTKQVVYEENLKPETPFDADPNLKEQAEAILKKYTLGHDGRYIAVIESICWIKEDK